MSILHLAVWLCVFPALLPGLALTPDADGRSSLSGKDVKSLPTVDTVLQKAVHSAGNFTEQAEVMYRHVQSRQQSIKAAMVSEKAEYEANLTTLHDENADLEFQITKTRENVQSVHKANTDLRSETEQIRRENELLRKTLGALMPKFSLAKEFMLSTLEVTDNEHADELKVLEPPKPHPTLARLLHVDGELDLGRPSGSFLQVSGAFSPEQSKDVKVPSAATKTGVLDGLVNMVSESLKELVGAGAEGRAELRAQFLSMYEKGMSRQKELQSELASQKTELEKMTLLQKDLEVARAKLLDTRKDLDDRLLGIRHFVRQVDRTVEKATKMVETSEQQVKKAAEEPISSEPDATSSEQSEKKAPAAEEVQNLMRVPAQQQQQAQQATLQCFEWCDGHEAAWPDKCNFVGCGACQRCAEVAKLNKKDGNVKKDEKDQKKQERKAGKPTNGGSVVVLNAKTSSVAKKAVTLHGAAAGQKQQKQANVANKTMSTLVKSAVNGTSQTQANATANKTVLSGDSDPKKKWFKWR